MKFDVVIIGGGIIGSAAAYFLAHAGNAGRVAVIERDPSYTLAATPQGAGGVRQLFSVTENIQMSQMSLAFYKAFDRDMAFTDYQPNIAAALDRAEFSEASGASAGGNGHGHLTSFSTSGTRAESDETFVVFEYHGGGCGGTSHCDGLDATFGLMANSFDNPVEAIESRSIRLGRQLDTHGQGEMAVGVIP